jgi:D-galactarolactone isomerase
MNKRAGRKQVTNDIARRTFLTTVAAATAAGAFGTASRAQQAVPNSTGTNPAKTAAPANATDCHMHIYDPRFAESNPRPGRNPKNATVSDYRLLQKRTGTQIAIHLMTFNGRPESSRDSHPR